MKDILVRSLRSVRPFRARRHSEVISKPLERRYIGIDISGWPGYGGVGKAVLEYGGVI